MMWKKNKGLKNLDAKYFHTEEYGKTVVLNPRKSLKSECYNLKIKFDDSKPTKYFICEDWSCTRSFVSHWNIAMCLFCGNLMNKEVLLKDSEMGTTNSNDGVFCNKTSSFIVTDDLQVMPNLSSSCIELLNERGIRDSTCLGIMTIDFGLKELKNQIIPNTFDSTAQLYCYSDKRVDYMTSTKGTNSGCVVYCPVKLRDPKIDGAFIRGPQLFMVTDNLVITNYSSFSAISMLNDMKIPFSDVEETAVSIGIDEALSILKASLHSKSALTDGLNLLLKNPKDVK